MNISDYFERLLADEGCVQEADAGLHESFRQVFRRDEELRAVASFVAGQPIESPQEITRKSDAASEGPSAAFTEKTTRFSHRQELRQLFPSTAASSLHPDVVSRMEVGYKLASNRKSVEIQLPMAVVEMAEFGFIQLCVELEGKLVESKFVPFKIAIDTSQPRIDLPISQDSPLQEKDAVLFFVCDSESLLSTMTVSGIRDLQANRLYANDPQSAERLALFVRRLHEHLN